MSLFMEKGSKKALSRLLRCSYAPLYLSSGQYFHHIVLHVCVLGWRVGLDLLIFVFAVLSQLSACHPAEIQQMLGGFLKSNW